MTYDQFLKDTACDWSCGKPPKKNPCAHMYWMSLQYADYLEEAEVEAITSGLIKHINAECGC